MSEELYGQLKSDQIALENENVRKIMVELSAKRLNDRQRWFMIYLLGLELMDHEELRTVAGFVKDMRPDAINIQAALEIDEKNTF